MVFTIRYEDIDYTFAYVQRYNVSQRPLSRVDKDLGLHRLYSRTSKPWEFIPITSIIRGALIMSDHDKPNDAFVLDIVDTDMYFRLRNIFPNL